MVEILGGPREIFPALRREDNRRRIKGYFGLHRLRGRLRRPGLMVALGGLRQFAVGRRLDFETPVARPMTEAWGGVTDARHTIDPPAPHEHARHPPAFGPTTLSLDTR